jgi:adenylosuccinate lyase
MIERYARPAMTAIWSGERKLAIWWEIELAACEAMATLGEIPSEAIQTLQKAKPPSVETVAAIERVTRHDTAAFVQAMEQQVGVEAGRFIHLGLTSSDIADTALSVQLKEAADLLLTDLDELSDVIESRAIEHKKTPMIGRTHGVHAEPTTFGLVLANWYAEVQRHVRRLTAARDQIAVGKISGAVGNFANVSPRVESYVCAKLGLQAALVSSQVIQRDRHAEFFTCLALIASSIEKFAVQVRHWQRTEVLEAEEAFRKGQKGSSAMPHKRNPILSENVTGLSRMVRSYALAAMENVALWHERDISHSSVERLIAPDATVTLDFLLARFTGIIENLIVYPENMLRNLDISQGLIFSGRLLVQLIKKGGLGREEAYKLVQRNAKAAYDAGGSFRETVEADSEVVERLGRDEIAACFDLSAAIGEVSTIFNRVFNKV